MEFHELLNDYISRLGCTAKELSVKSGVSASVISRYRTGDRVPTSSGEQVMRLASGISTIAAEKNIVDILSEDIYAALISTVSSLQFDFDAFIDKLNKIIYFLGINLTELSKKINFDVSFLSKIRSGQRRPANPEKFVDGICLYIAEHYCTDDAIKITSETTEMPLAFFSTKDSYIDTLKSWFTTNEKQDNTSFSDFLRRFDEFDIEEYIQGVELEEPGYFHVDPDVPLIKDYYGKVEMWRAIQDFFKLTLSSDSKAPVFICSDFPFSEILDDIFGSNTFISMLLACIKKGICIQVVHNLDRNTSEITPNLKMWIPLYMTGLVSPYFLKNSPSEIYRITTFVSGVAALHGECLADDIDNGKMYLTNCDDEVYYYRHKADSIIRKSNPLLEVYTENQKNIFLSMLESDSMTAGKRHNLLTTLPIYTMPEDLLYRILERHGLAADFERLKYYICKHKMIVERITAQSELTDEVIVLPREAFENEKISVSILGAFYDNQLNYTYDEYIEHLEATKEYERNNSNYRVICSEKNVFRNIRIALHEDKWVIVSRNKAPIVHYIIRHPGFRKIVNIYSAENTEK